MRALGLVGLLLALVVVGMLVRKQLGAGPPSPSGSAAPPGASAPAQNPRQTQEQFKQSLDAAMQQQRPLPDEAK
jgi:hypothetical protein